MSRTHYMPLYWAEFLADTLHLSACEMGAYTLLLGAMWRAGGTLPRDDRKLAQITRQSPEAWLEMKETVMDFFTVRGGRMTQKKLSEELAKANTKIEVAKRAGKASASTKANKNKGIRSTPVEVPFQQNANHLELDSYTPIVPKGTALPEAVNRIWSKAPKISRERSSKADLTKALEAAVKRGCDLAGIESGLAAYFGSEDATRDGGRFVKGVHRLVQADRWASHVEPQADLLTQPTMTEAEARMLAWTKNRYWNPDWGDRPGREAR